MPNKNISIQVLRAIAAILVVNYHVIGTLEKYYSNKSWISQQLFFKDFGAVGVDIFFVISGFIMISTNWLNFGKSGSPSYFLKNRIIRIVPLYWLFTSLAFFVAFFLPSLTSIQPSWSNFLSSLLFFPLEKFPILKVGWTLNYEMYFYLIFSVLLLCSRKIFVCAGLSFLLLSLICRNFINKDIPLAVLVTDPLLLEFSMGCAIGFVYKKGLSISFPKIFLIFGVLAFLPSIIFGLNDNLRLFFWGIPSALIVAGLVFENNLSKDIIFNTKILVFSKLGESSYALYLSHALIMPIIGKLWVFSGLVRIFCADIYIVVATLILVIFGHIIYLLIEQPITNFIRDRMLTFKINFA